MSEISRDSQIQHDKAADIYTSWRNIRDKKSVKKLAVDEIDSIFFVNFYKDVTCDINHESRIEKPVDNKNTQGSNYREPEKKKLKLIHVRLSREKCIAV